jgi:hypothetical protein
MLLRSKGRDDCRTPGKMGSRAPRNGTLLPMTGTTRTVRRITRAIVRRGLALTLLIALLAPCLIPAMRGGSAAASAGSGCCGAMACCAAEAPCATGACAHGAHAGVASHHDQAASPHHGPLHAPRLAAACPGPASAITLADRDPMLPSAAAAIEFAAEPALAYVPFTVSPSTRNDAPSVPPPRG